MTHPDIANTLQRSSQRFTRPRTPAWIAVVLLAGLVNTHPVFAQFGSTQPIVLPAERALDPTAVYSAERMDQQVQQQLQLRNQDVMQQEQDRLREEMSQMQQQMQMQDSMRNEQLRQQELRVASAPQSSGTPQPGGDWIELDSPLTITNNGSTSSDVSFEYGNGSGFENGYENGNGAGYVYEEGYDDGFWSDLDCDCRQCKRRHVLGKCGGCCKPDFGGWIAAGYYNNAHGGNGSFGNSPLGFNNIAGAQLNQAWLYAENPVARGNGWDFGYRMDFMFGADGPDTQAFGDGQWDGNWDTSGQYGFAMPQLYVEGAYGNTSVKLGHFFTIIGYEVVPATGNFFYSHAYTMYYNEPFTHTGILASHDWSDNWTLHFGYTFGWDTGFTNANNGGAFLGGVTWSPSDYFSVAYATTVGDPGDDPLAGSDTYMHSIVVDTLITDNLEWVLQTDFQNRQSAIADGRSYGLVNYLFYQWDDCTSFGLRYEWFRDKRGIAAVAGASEHFHAITLGMNRQITDRFMLRPEVRVDWANRDFGFAGAAFDNGTRNSQLTFGSQAIWTF